MNQIGLQIYTVRNLLKTDEYAQRIFHVIKEIGYKGVQIYGPRGSVEQAGSYAKFAKEAGLAVEGILVDIDSCETNEESLFALCREHHIPEIGISSRFSDFEEIDSYIERVNRFAARAKAEGLRFSYHNHGHEFIRLADGKRAMDRFLEEFDNAIDFMPDTYWIQDGGYDVRYFLEQTKGRVNVLHLKDMKRTEEGHTYAEVGCGNLYFEGIIKTALDCGIRQFFVEQDLCEGDPLDSIKISYENTLKILEGIK